MSSNSFKLEPGHTISHFRLEKLLGEGGMGAVYLAEDLTLSRRVAIKFMRRSMLATLPNPEIRKKVEGRFIREAKSAASINHPNIAQIYEANFETDHWYIAMEFIDGKPLDEILTKDGPFKVKRAMDIILQVSNGLEYAWDSYKIIHRDIKPQNLMLSKRGHVKIVDLGLAKPIIESGEEELELTGAGVPVGTPYYMAPEQAAGGTVNHQTDIFALGATIYELLSGKKCFQGKTPPMIYNKQINKDYLPLTEFGIDEKVSRLIDRMLEPDQSKRVDCYDALIDEVEGLKDGKTKEHIIANMQTIDDSRTAAGHTVSTGSLDMDVTLDDSNAMTMSSSMFGTVITGTPVDDMQTMVDIFYPVDYKIMDRYRILKVIGRGNSGIVYHCMDTQLERECSVKSVVSGREYTPQVFPRIKKNYIKMSARKHPNLVEVYDVQVSEDGNEVFIIMELLKGENLLQHTNSLSHINEEVSVSSIEPMLRKIAKALDSVSQEFHIVHNDLKPVSIFITEDKVIKILDYGVTYLAPVDDPHVGSPDIWKHPIANPDYMSPELWDHKKPNMASDQYSFAVIIYEILSHKLPFWMKELQSTIEQDDSYMLGLLEKQYQRVLNENPAPISSLDSNQNKALSKALAKTPQQRFPTCEAFIDNLSGKVKSGMNPMVLAAAIVLIGIGVAGFLIFNKNKGHKLEAENLSKSCNTLVAKIKGHVDTSDIDKALESIKQDFANEDFKTAKAKLFDLETKLKKVITDKKSEITSSLNAKKSEFEKLSTRVDELIKIQDSLAENKKNISFPSFSEEDTIQALTDANDAASTANEEMKVIIEMGNKSLEEQKSILSKEISTLASKWKSVEGEPGLEEKKKEFDAKITAAKSALENSDIAAAGKSKADASNIFKSANQIVNSKYKDEISKKKASYLKMKEETKPILYFLEGSKVTFTKIEQRDSLWTQAVSDSQLKLAFAHLETQIKDLQALKTQLETTAKETFIRNINNKKIDCLTKKSDMEGFKDLIKDYASLEKSFTTADTLFKRNDYQNAKNEYDRLDAKLKAMQSELDKELKTRVNNLHNTVVELAAQLEKNKEINPDISIQIDDFDINFQVVRAKKSENKYRAAYGEYQKLVTLGKSLVEKIKKLATPTVGKDWSVPVLNMKFTWVKDLKFWVGTYEVTNGEYRKFKPEFKNRTYDGIGTLNGDNQPVSMVSYRDAANYCKWLTVKAREKGQLPKGFIYRLPKGDEWKKFATSGKTSSIYPWGDKWPPAIKVNIGSKGVVKDVVPEWNDYKDDYPLTAPVDKSGKNPWNIFGCSGNVWEWTLDAEGDKRAVFGGSWNSMQKFMLKMDLGGQNFAPEKAANDDIGFRIVLAPPITN